MIQTLRMRDYKCFASEPDGGPVRIELEPLTLLVGPCGSLGGERRGGAAVRAR